MIVTRQPQHRPGRAGGHAEHFQQRPRAAVQLFPLNQTGPTADRGQGLLKDTWWHVAVVNDGRHTVMYVEDSPVVDNPSTVSIGIHRSACHGWSAATSTPATSTRFSTAGSAMSAS